MGVVMQAAFGWSAWQGNQNNRKEEKTMSPLRNYLTESTTHTGTNRPTAIPLMQYISTLDLHEMLEASAQAEQPSQPSSAVPDTELWSK